MKNVLAAALVAAVIQSIVWTYFHESSTPPDVFGRIDSVSYTPTDLRDPGKVPPAEMVDKVTADLALLRKHVRAIRLYSSVGIYGLIPEIAKRDGMSVTAGAWINGWDEANRKEIDALVKTANENTNVTSVIVGNETILRKEQTVASMEKMLDEVRAKVDVPVSTGETWDTWLAHPELAEHVDFIAAHILPYWEGIPAQAAVGHAINRYEALEKAFPGKRIVIAEFGWPSHGYNNLAAQPNLVSEAETIRAFVKAARKNQISYNVIEAFDQPWKGNEGSVGAYWGLYDSARNPKFPMTGMVETPHKDRGMGLAMVLGALITIAAMARSKPLFGQALAFSLAANALAAGVAVAALYPVENYLNVGSALAWAIGIMLMIPLTVMTLVKVDEVASVTLGREPRRLVRASQTKRSDGPHPKVSVHIAAYKESPDMLIQTLNSVAALDYPNFEVLVIINNTPEERYWKPIEAHCEALGERFKFLNFQKVSGFKAGALNMALPYMAKDAEIIATLDADYVVEPGWLADLVPLFADENVALVQAPQDHRDGAESVFKSFLNSEYSGFFDIGMVQRNEDNAIVAHGTMLLMRRSAFEKVGGWQTDTITEDTELGLRLYEAGYSAQYTNRRYGYGLLPDNYRAFKTQRNRWAYGATQIIRKHWREMLPGARRLQPAQKRQFVLGWSYWFADAMGVLAAIMNLLCVPLIFTDKVMIPTLPFTLPILVAFGVNILHCSILYLARVKAPIKHIAGAALAASSLQWTVAVAMAKGFVKVNLPFLRTEKGGIGGVTRNPVIAESLMGLLLLAGAAALYMHNTTKASVMTIFAITLLTQSIPFVAATVMYALEGAKDFRLPTFGRLIPLTPRKRLQEAEARVVRHRADL